MNGIDELLRILGTLEFEENGRLRLLEAHWDAATLRLQFEAEEGNDRVSRWELAFDGVLEEHLSGVYYPGLNVWYDDHVVIDQYTARVETLAFTGAAADPDRVLGQLWTAHREITDDWIPFDRYFNEATRLRPLLAQTSGVLATGPKFLMDAYADVLAQNGCEPKTVGRSRAGRVKHACMAHFDESYVVAKKVNAKRLTT